MVALSTGPVERGADTDRVRVVVLNTGRCPVRVTVLIRDVGRAGRGHGRHKPILFRRRVVLPGRTAVFDADLGAALRYEVRLHTPSRRLLFYVFGYHRDRWWPGLVPDPAATFRHTELVRLDAGARRPTRAPGVHVPRCRRA